VEVKIQDAVANCEIVREGTNRERYSEEGYNLLATKSKQNQIQKKETKKSLPKMSRRSSKLVISRRGSQLLQDKLSEEEFLVYQFPHL
jgi:hypothetical protein